VWEIPGKVEEFDEEWRVVTLLVAAEISECACIECVDVYCTGWKFKPR